MISPTVQNEQTVLAAVLADPLCAAVLDRLPSLGLPEWWLTAGAVFQNVWNAVDSRPPGYGIKDYDVFYYDDTDLSWEAEDAVIRGAADLLADIAAPTTTTRDATFSEAEHLPRLPLSRPSR